MTSSITSQSHGAEAHDSIQRAIHLLKHTGFWHPQETRREVVLHITKTENEPVTIAPMDGDHLLILISPGVTTTILEHATSATASVDIIIEEASSVTYASTSEGSTKIHRFAHLDTDASISWVDYAVGEHVTSDVTTFLAGTGAQARFASCFLGNGSEEYKVRSQMIHAGNKSTSHMLTRAALLGKSKGSYDGLIRILPHARGCDAYQRGEFLLLSKDARMRAEPNLEIGNEDVKCSHGVSLSRVDSEKLFYFGARGIPEIDAKHLIISGFFAQIIDLLPLGAESRREEIARRVTE